MRWPWSKPSEVSRDSLVAFVRAGGSLSMTEWLGMDDATRAACERAGTAVRAEQALLISACIHGETDEAEVLLGGDRAQAAQDAARAEMSRALGGKRVVSG